MSLPNSYHLRQEPPPSHVVNFSRPRFALTQEPSQASIDSIDNSLIPPPLQLRHPPSQAALQPQYAYSQQSPTQAQAQTQSHWQFAPPRLSFDSSATIDTKASFTADSLAASDLSSNDHFNLFHDPEQRQDDSSDLTEPCSDGPNPDTIPEGSICSEQSHFGVPYLDWTPRQQPSDEANGHTITYFPFPQPQPRPDSYRYPMPQPTLTAPFDDNWIKGDAWCPPKHPRTEERNSFEQLSANLPPSAAPAEQPKFRLRHSLEYNRQGSFGSLGSLTRYFPSQPSDSSSTFATTTDSSETSLTKVDTNTSSRGNALSSKGSNLSSKGSNLKREWSPSTQDVSSLDDKKSARLHRRGLNLALYQEMREARKRGA